MPRHNMRLVLWYTCCILLSKELIYLAKNRDRIADYIDELADKTQQKWRMISVSKINRQYKNDTCWTEEIIQLLPFFYASSLRHRNLTEKQRRVIQMNKSCQKMIQLPSFFFFFPLLIEVPRTQPLGSPHNPVYCPGQALCQKGKRYLFFHLVTWKSGRGRWENRAPYKGTHHISTSIFCLAANEGRGLKTLWYLFCPSDFSVCFVGKRISDLTGNWGALSAAKGPSPQQ